ncbi:MAG TPA: acetyl-CoA carboxylase biotin carboxyl carrier protein [Azospirillaceae bacterium]|nr:acetyl-CoA carboxylase biotin carboxyl carrier protein [Azospirillaceae bacterium]
MASFDIDGDLIRKLADLLNETGLSEIEFAEGDRRLRVSRAVAAPAAVAVAAPATTVATAPAVNPAGSALPAGTVTSPMVGTAYLAAEPGGAPFVRVGDQVKAGQTLLIIEAMKVMNPIKAPKSGTVTDIFADDAQPVEYGEPLMVIE